MPTQDELKQAAAKMAAEMVQPHMALGVGTGSTVAFFIDELAKQNRDHPLDLAAVITTSSRSRRQLEANGFTVSELADVDFLDLTIDGADRVDPDFNGIKGGGAAHTLEKNVAVNSKKNLWIVDESKLCQHLGGFPLPVEVLPVSAKQNFARFEQEGLMPRYRLKADGSKLTTHYGNWIIDLCVDPLPVPAGLAAYLDACVGVVEHGLFLNIAEEVLVAKQDGTIAHLVK